MNISQENRDVIVKEFRDSAKLMRGTPNAEKKMFYFSSTYGVLSRIFNLEYNAQVVFLHFVLNNAYGNIHARIDAIKKGDLVVDFPDNYFEKLAERVEQLAGQIEEKKSTYSTLEKIAELTFLTTGNGCYLREKGIIKV